MSRLRPRPRAAVALLAALTMLLIIVPTASAAYLRTAKDGTKYYRYKFPLTIKPGQNDIAFEGKMGKHRPSVDGYITYFKPDLVRKNGEVPPVDVIHLHHAVWLVDFNPTFAAGEEKTILRAPKGYGWTYTTKQRWLLNHMIHNLTPNDDKVWVQWTIGFVPKGSRAAEGIRPVSTRWMDVEGLQAYPVFDVLRGSGGDGRFTYPNEAQNPYAGRRRPRNEWIVDRDTTAVGTAGHVHPGGLYTDLYVERDGRKVHLFRSRAKYYEPAGPVSWDVSMTATPENWRVKLKAGDKVSLTATYDTRRGSWYESMGIMPLAITDSPAGGKDPFTEADEIPKNGKVTHGQLPENDNHGGGESGLPDARRLPDGPRIAEVPIRQFIYTQGDLSLTGRAGRPPVVSPGQALGFRSEDGDERIYHTVTSCKAPCNGLTGVAFPLANDGPASFDSGQLALGGEPTANRVTWSTPTSLQQGTYNYFCRVHPFMRGAFRVKS
jgi:plastocyanin